MRRFIVLALPLALAASALAGVAGTYAGHGENPPGGSGPYDCEVVISQSGDIYSVQWYFGGQLGYDGVGIMKNGLLCVGYAASGGYGVVVYEVQADGSLAGVWATPGFTDVGTETLKKK